MKPKRIREEYEALLQSGPDPGLRRAAAELKITEGELVAAHAGEGMVVRLNNDLEGQLASLPTLGAVLAVTRSSHVIHESAGRYPTVRTYGKCGLAVSDVIDVRMRLDHWAHGFASEFGGRRELVFFDGRGQAVHRLVATPGSDAAAWDNWITAFAADRQSTLLDIDSGTDTGTETPEVERDTLCHAWDALRHEDDFTPLIERLGLRPLEALRLAAEPYARRLGKEALHHLLRKAAESALPVRVLAHNRGCTQIYTGPLAQVAEFGEWLNILDPRFNLHLEMKGVDTVWCVWRPNTTGGVTTVEIFDRAGNLILDFAAPRAPRDPEDPDWRSLCQSLPAPDAADDL